MISIDLIAGARPNFVKIAPLIAAIEGANAASKRIEYRLVHTGQHYDRELSGTFFEQLRIPAPDINLGAGGGTQAQQTAAIMIAYERVLADSPALPRLCLVVGDVTSTMACAITARKMGVEVGHVEAGIRSGDWTMPEEINRVVTDSLSNWFYTTSALAGENLRASGTDPARIFFVGNTMIDTLLRFRGEFFAPAIWRELGLEPRKYLVLTLHRPATVDSPRLLAAILDAIARHAGGVPVIFPVHPRTRKILDGLEQRFPGIVPTAPLSYLEFNHLVERSLAVITDSGGITEEATVLGVPCMTLRNNTERPETVELGTNELLGTDPKAIAPALQKLFSGGWKRGSIPPLWDGRTSERIVDAILQSHEEVNTAGQR